MLLKKTTLLLLSLLLSLQAMAANNSGLAEAINELQYELTVNWDQQDQNFYQDQTKIFSEKIKELQGRGLSNQQLIDYTVSRIKDEKLAKDAQSAFTMIQLNNMSSEEAQHYVKELIGKRYNTGASWTGDAAEVIITIAFLAAIAYVAVVVWDKTCFSRCERSCYGFGTFCYDDCRQRCY
jgi:hypothetical protein